MSATFTTAGGINVTVISPPQKRDGSIKVETFRADTGGRHGWLHLGKLRPTNNAAVAMVAMVAAPRTKQVRR